MPTDKRERQRELRRERIEAVRASERASRNRQRFVIGGLVAAFVVVAIGIGIFAGDDDDAPVAADQLDEDPALDDDSVPDEDGDDHSDDADPAAEIAGTPPTTAPVDPPAEPVCPPAEGATPTYFFTGPFENCLTEGVDYRARFTTTLGDVVVDLRETEMPRTVNNFVALARYGYYDGTDLFRTDPSIDIIQGGSPHTQDNGDPGPGYTIEDEGEFVNDPETGQYTGPFSYGPGQLMMARTGAPDSSGGQFFFSTGPNVSNLDSQGTYLLFGDVVEGLDVLQQVMDLHQAGGPLGGRPSQYVIVEDVEIIEA